MRLLHRRSSKRGYKNNRKWRRSERKVEINAGAVLLALLGTALLLSTDVGHFLWEELPYSIKKSINLGGGKCRWQPPDYNVSPVAEYFKTIIAGFPSGDKRLTFVQMEALTGLPAKDEWDFKFLGMSNHPFIKANYPHHEGIWGWQDVADQAIMVVRNIKRAMVEYHDILWDIGYAKTWADAFERIPMLYAERPPMSDFLAWRDLRVPDEIHWYGWFVDYWMEGGLMRDMFTHKITTPEHWNMLMQPTRYTKFELEYDRVVGADTVVTPSYDPHCLNDVTLGCEPVAVISAEKLVDHTQGPAIARKIASVIQNKTGMDVIAEEARECIWGELIVNKKGLKTFIDRHGYGEEEYSFTQEQLEGMVAELDRLIDKYGSLEWNWKPTAQDLVALLQEHRGLIQADVDAGMYRRMKKKDTTTTSTTSRPTGIPPPTIRGGGSGAAGLTKSLQSTGAGGIPPSTRGNTGESTKSLQQPTGGTSSGNTKLETERN